MTRRQRLDLELVARGLVASRQRAQQLIRAGRVRSGSTVLDKPGLAVDPALPLVVEQPPRFVSRGGEKLEAALAALPVTVDGRVCLDGGISTGGFSDCLLQRGASRVYGIDVGYGQTAWSLRTDPRIVLRERTNLRHLEPEQLYGPGDPWPDLAVADVSFISLAKVLPALRRLLAGNAEAVVLVKPQFEVGRERVGRGGVVRDPAAHRDAIAAVIAAASGLAWTPAGLLGSPICGPAGNHEYLLWLVPDHPDPGLQQAARAEQLRQGLDAVVSATLAGQADGMEPWRAAGVGSSSSAHSGRRVHASTASDATGSAAAALESLAGAQAGEG